MNRNSKQSNALRPFTLGSQTLLKDGGGRPRRFSGFSRPEWQTPFANMTLMCTEDDVRYTMGMCHQPKYGTCDLITRTY